jgi:hypothetical protein
MHFLPKTVRTVVTQMKTIYPIIALITLYLKYITLPPLNLHDYTGISKGPFSQQAGLLGRWLGSLTEAGEIKQ